MAPSGSSERQTVCRGDPSTFGAGPGRCDAYSQSTSSSCSDDVDPHTRLSAAQVCPQCGLCRPPDSTTPLGEEGGPEEHASAQVVDPVVGFFVGLALATATMCLAAASHLLGRRKGRVPAHGSECDDGAVLSEDPPHASRVSEARNIEWTV